MQPKFLITANGAVPTPMCAVSSASCSGTSVIEENRQSAQKRSLSVIVSQESPKLSLPSAKKMKKPSFESGMPALIESQNALLEKNSQQMRDLTFALRDGLTAIAKSIRYLADRLPKP